MRYSRIVIAMTALVLGASREAGAQATDPSVRLKEVLPADVATRVLAVIARARSHELPASALENRALKFAARGVRPDSIERSVVEHAQRMERAKSILEQARNRRAADDEVEAGAEALRKGVDGAGVAALARSAPRDRSLAVPLYVVGGLLDRGLASDAALARVVDRLNARASDADLERLPSDLPSQAATGQSHRPAETGRAIAETKRGAAGPGAGAGGPPAGVPKNGGAGAKPGRGGKPATPPGKRP